MILALLNLLGGWYRLEGARRDAAAFLNLCMHGCYPYWDFAFADDAFSVCVRRRVWRELSAACAARRISLCCAEEGGLPRILRRYRRRWGLMAGALVCAGIIWLSGCFVWEIDVIGTERYHARDVLEELSAQGFGVGSYIPSIDVNVLQNRVLIDSERFAWISVNLFGSCAQVEVVEYKERQTEPRQTEPANLVASVDGQITRFELRAGWPAVKVGDVVQAGELLASGIGETKDARTLIARAEGKVYAQVRHELSVEIPFVYEAKRYTGEKYEEKRIIFFGKELKFLQKTGILGQSCDTIENERILTFFEGLRVPVSLCTTTRMPYVIEPARRDEAAALELAYFTLRHEIDALGNDVELLRQSVTTTITDDAVRLDCTLYCIENIAQSYPIMLGETAEPQS